VTHLLELRDVTVGYGGRPALDSVSLAVDRGAQIAVVGPNGAGKSTLFKALVGLLPIRSGEMLVAGRPAAASRTLIGYVPQREEVDWRFPVTVYDVVAMGRYGPGRWLRRLSHTDREVIADCLQRLGITEVANRPIGELSGGQQQRVFLARALAQEPEILLLDEPFTGVDVGTREAILELLKDLRERAVTVIASTHDLDLAVGRFEQVILLNRRLISVGDPRSVFSEEHLLQAFGGQMVVVDGRVIVVDQCCGGGETHDREGHGRETPTDGEAGESGRAREVSA
jgi:ABC-type Mn2+/Zn2+ transport system ATPase subunit